MLINVIIYNKMKQIINLPTNFYFELLYVEGEL